MGPLTFSDRIGVSTLCLRGIPLAEPIVQWHAENEAYLYDRTPVANVGLVWSQDNTEFYGRNSRRERVALPWRGFIRALTRARIPYLPVHADHIERDAPGLDLLILPDVGAMSEAQCEAVRRFVKAGGNLVATGRSSLFDEWSEPRDDFALADLLGVHATGNRHGPDTASGGSWERHDAHNYLRLERQEGSDTRHPVIKGFEETNILPFGGTVEAVKPETGVTPLSTYVPAFPIYPPEFSWMRQPHTDIPTVLVRESPSGGRVVYFAADVDRCYGRQHLPDHGDLLANATRWAAHDRLPLTVRGPGYLDCHLYRQPGRLILHLVNLSGATAWPTYMEEHLPVGPIQVAVKLEQGMTPAAAEPRVAKTGVQIQVDNRAGGGTARRKMIANRGVDIVQPDLHYYGGLIRSTRVARMAAVAGMPTTVHISGGFGFIYMLIFASFTPDIGRLCPEAPRCCGAPPGRNSSPPSPQSSAFP